MTDVSWERWARATGIVFVVLFVVGFLVAGDPPGLNDSTAQIAAFYEGDSGRVLTATFILGVAVVFFLWFSAAIASALREAGKGGWAAATIASAAALGAVFLAHLTLSAGLAFKIAADGDEGIVTALNDLTWMFVVIAAFPAAGVIAAASFGLWRTRLVADWFAWAGVAAAVVVLISGTTWAEDGFWAPDGAYSLYVATIVFLGWTLVASGLLYARSPAVAAAPERAAATPAP